MSIKETIRSDMKDAMRAKDSVKLSVVRGLLSAFTNEVISSGGTPQDDISDEAAMVVLKREAKRRKDAINQYTEGGRPELAADEQAELEIIEGYLPEMMSREEIKPVVERKIAEMGVTDKSGMGKLIGAVMAELGSNVDGADVKAVAEELLS